VATKGELNDAIDYIASIQSSDVVKGSKRLQSDLARLELKYHRELRELGTRGPGRRSRKAKGSGNGT
jgi:hypothetical protein